MSSTASSPFPFSSISCPGKRFTELSSEGAPRRMLGRESKNECEMPIDTMNIASPVDLSIGSKSAMNAMVFACIPGMNPVNIPATMPRIAQEISSINFPNPFYYKLKPALVVCYLCQHFGIGIFSQLRCLLCARGKENRPYCAAIFKSEKGVIVPELKAPYGSVHLPRLPDALACDFGYFHCFLIRKQHQQSGKAYQCQRKAHLRRLFNRNFHYLIETRKRLKIR